jgi:hypothetical protein
MIVIFKKYFKKVIPKLSIVSILPKTAMKMKKLKI